MLLNAVERVVSAKFKNAFKDIHADQRQDMD
jgi:hypothetical protein